MNVQDYGSSLRSQALGMLEAGETTKKVAQMLNVNIRSVQRWGRCDKLGISMESKLTRPPKIELKLSVIVH